MKLGPHTITVVHSNTAPEDPYGNPSPDWAGASQTSESGWSVQPLAGQEAIVGRDTVVSRWQGLGPATSVLTATDRVVYAGATYEVDGEVQRWDFPPLAHVVCFLKRSHS